MNQIVTVTTAPFLVSVPMTSVDGSEWLYDVTVYPKNLTGDPTLEKAVREHGDEDYAHTATASIGDTLEYRIVSMLPEISSAPT